MKAVFIGSRRVYEAMRNKFKPDWDWQVPLKNVDEFWQASDEGRIADDTNIILVSDEFYIEGLRDPNRKRGKQTMDGFLEIITVSSSAALTGVINFNNKKDQIHNALLDYAGHNDDLVLNKYWFINPKHFQPSIDGAIKEYINNPKMDRDNAQQMAESLGLSMKTILPDEDEDGDEDVEDDSEYYSNEPVFTNNYHKKAHIITVTSTKGGAGKTTTAVGMATWLSGASKEAADQGLLKSELKVCVVDLDVYDGQIGTMIGKASPTMMQIAIIDDPTQQEINKYLIKDDRLGISVLLSPRLPDSAKSITVQKYMDTITKLRYMFDVIILDTSINHTTDICTKVAYPMANNILFVTTLDRKAIIGMAKWILFHYVKRVDKETFKIGLDMRKVGIDINMAMRNVSMGVQQINRVIEKACVTSYQHYRPDVPKDAIPKPKIIGAVPDIPNGTLIRLSNIQQFNEAMNITPFANNIGSLACELMPKAFGDVLRQLLGQ